MSSTIIPCLRYRNTPAAIDWLGQVFGMHRQAVYAADDGSVMPAQLTLGPVMINPWAS